MKAAEYLAQLQSAYRHFSELSHAAMMYQRGPGTFNDVSIVDGLVGDYSAQLSPEDAERTREELRRVLLGQQENPWLNRIHDEFMRGVSDEAQLSLTTDYDLAVGVLRSADINGSAYKVPDEPNSWLITLNEGLEVFVYGCMRAIVSTTSLRPDQDRPAQPPSQTEADAAADLAEMVRYYTYFGIPQQTRRTVSRPHRDLAAHLTDLAERFVYSHEMSHVLLGHTNSAPLQALPDAYHEGPQLASSVDQEYEADILGWNLFVRIFVADDGRISGADLQAAYAAAHLFLRLASILEKAQGGIASATHPEAEMRMLVLKMAAASTASEGGVTFDAVESLSIGVESALDRIERLLPVLPGTSPLQELLRNAVDEHPYLSIDGIMARGSARGELLRLLSFGAPGKLCYEIGRALADAETELLRLGIDVRTAPDEDVAVSADTMKLAAKPFRIFTLLAGLVAAYLPPDVRKFIDRHHDRLLAEARRVN
ncbi:hypothetical protein [Virgisporangium ochraceum]|uniref:hypothetical protein n=1 Tax=Virgisporangium ochraceum TaxID=65505 RepID=UPI0019403D73|nr:hypothetical protein [Virgisporangium ochraceum]